MDCVFRLDLVMDNDAFGVTKEQLATETARILKEAASKIESDPLLLFPGRTPAPLRDLNGNQVGGMGVSIE